MINLKNYERLVSGMTQFEVINALYDSKIFTKIKLTAGAKLVLIALARHYNPQNVDFFPSYSCIAEHTGVSKKSVERAIKELVGAGLIRYKTQKVNRYQFTEYFFDSVNLSAEYRQNVVDEYRQNVAQTNKEEKRNKKEEVLKNSFKGGAISSNQDGAESETLTGNDFKVDYCKYSQSKSYQNFRRAEQNNGSSVGSNITPSGAFRVTNYSDSGQNDGSQNDRYQNDYYQKGGVVGSRGGRIGAGNSTNDVRGEAVSGRASAKPTPVKMTDGGSCRVPSVAETRAYLDELVESRKYACAPIDFEPWRAERWYKSLNPLLKTSVMAKKVKAKFGFED